MPKSKKTNSDESGQPKVTSGMKRLRDKKVLSLAMEGKKTTQEIADEVGLTRQTVSGILNSGDAKTLLREIDSKLRAGIDGAINTVVTMARAEYTPARDLLRNFGAMKLKVNLEHTGKDGEPLGYMSDEDVEIRYQELIAKGKA